MTHPRLGAALLPALAPALLGAALAGCARHASPGAATPAAGDAAQARAAADRFLAAFDSLQWEPFRAALAPDVTVFMPGGADPPGRLDGRAAVEAEFRRFFDGVRASRAQAGRPAAPFLGLAGRVRDVHVQVLGTGAAVVSFHLGAAPEAAGAVGGAGAPPARRSLVFRREADGAWRVVHWHASAPPRPAAR